MFVIRADTGTDIKSVEPLPDTVGSQYMLPKTISTHALKAMRVGENEQLQLCDGHGLRILASVVDNSNGVVRVADVMREVQPRIKLGLIQALAKGGRDEQAIEMATEIGVDHVIPWQAQRSIVQWKGNKATKALSKWDDVLISATQQSRRSFVPTLHPMMTTKQLGRWMIDTIHDGDIILVLHQDATVTWSEFEQKIQTVEEGHTIWVVVGPEGGITDDEIELFKNGGAYSCVIGSNILRAASAGPVALTLFSRCLGRYA